MKQRRKKNKKNVDILTGLWGNEKLPNIWIIGVPEEKDKKKDYEKILEGIISENFYKMGNE